MKILLFLICSYVLNSYSPHHQRHVISTGEPLRYLQLFSFFFKVFENTKMDHCLYRDCNQREQVISTFNDFYVALYHRVYQVWKYQHKTIQDSGFVLKEIEKYAKKNARILIHNLDYVLTERRALIMPEEANPSPKNRFVDRVERFAGVCDLQVDEEEEVHLV